MLLSNNLEIDVSPILWPKHENYAKQRKYFENQT